MLLVVGRKGGASRPAVCADFRAAPSAAVEVRNPSPGRALPAGAPAMAPQRPAQSARLPSSRASAGLAHDGLSRRGGETSTLADKAAATAPSQQSHALTRGARTTILFLMPWMSAIFRRRMAHAGSLIAGL